MPVEDVRPEDGGEWQRFSHTMPPQMRLQPPPQLHQHYTRSELALRSGRPNVKSISVRRNDRRHAHALQPRRSILYIMYCTLAAHVERIPRKWLLPAAARRDDSNMRSRIRFFTANAHTHTHIRAHPHTHRHRRAHRLFGCAENRSHKRREVDSRLNVVDYAVEITRHGLIVIAVCTRSARFALNVVGNRQKFRALTVAEGGSSGCGELASV